MKKLKCNLRLLIGAWYYSFGFCPKCNSTAPELYDCSICNHNKTPKAEWWDNFTEEVFWEDEKIVK